MSACLCSSSEQVLREVVSNAVALERDRFCAAVAPDRMLERNQKPLSGRGHPHQMAEVRLQQSGYSHAGASNSRLPQGPRRRLSSADRPRPPGNRRGVEPGRTFRCSPNRGIFSAAAQSCLGTGEIGAWSAWHSNFCNVVPELVARQRE